MMHAKMEWIEVSEIDDDALFSETEKAKRYL